MSAFGKPHRSISCQEECLVWAVRVLDRDEHAATDLMAAVSPICEFSFFAARARSM